LPELSTEILARLTAGEEFRTAHIELDRQGGLRFTFDGPSTGG
jgi:hypothetical protein